MSIVENMQCACRKNGITIPEVEKELGFGKGSMYKWDKNLPAFDKIQKVANYLKVTTDYLVYGHNRSLLASTLRVIMNGRTLEKYSNDTGVAIAELAYLLEEIAEQRPSIEIIEKIIKDNPLSFMFTAEDIYKHAGYDVPEKYRDQPHLPAPSTCQSTEIDQDEEKLLKIFKTLSNKNKAALLLRAYELEEEQNK
ncbi:hypothetical protein [Pelosinus sp. IPA-1]|uniref:hypothetical protein n=1 Tax=Pelosinus sp. IPA-1 TaxID=3029569 RepID=UPI0024361973|nr:hypothetical protein [Pelosinus sp. IPA-1]GMB00882.1 hypothetical protein PIPA1_36810 [Pelosinus sp. IPA-1]